MSKSDLFVNYSQSLKDIKGELWLYCGMSTAACRCYSGTECPDASSAAEEFFTKVKTVSYTHFVQPASERFSVKVSGLYCKSYNYYCIRGADLYIFYLRGD